MQEADFDASYCNVHQKLQGCAKIASDGVWRPELDGRWEDKAKITGKANKIDKAKKGFGLRAT